MSKTSRRRLDLGWYKRFPDKALSGMFELNLEQRGAYGTIIDLIYSRAGELPHDIDLIKSHLKVDARVTRRLLAELIDRDKIQIVDGLIRTRKSDVEIMTRIDTITAQSEGGKAGAEKRWNLSSEEVSGKFGESLEEVSQQLEPNCDELEPKLSGTGLETLETNGGNEPMPAKDTHSQKPPTRAREKEKEKEEESTPSTESLKSEVAKFDDDIFSRVNHLATIVGLNLTQPAKLVKAIEQLKQWTGEGIDFEATILPIIKSRSADNPNETVYSLTYFDGAVRKRHGLSAQGIKPPGPPRAPRARPPINASDAADDRVATYRERLRTLLGDEKYSLRFAPAHVAIEVVDDRLVKIKFRSSAELATATALFDFELERAARQMGLSSTTEALRT